MREGGTRVGRRTGPDTLGDAEPSHHSPSYRCRVNMSRQQRDVSTGADGSIEIFTPTIRQMSKPSDHVRTIRTQTPKWMMRKHPEPTEEHLLYRKGKILTPSSAPSDTHAVGPKQEEAGTSLQTHRAPSTAKSPTPTMKPRVVSTIIWPAIKHSPVSQTPSPAERKKPKNVATTARGNSPTAVDPGMPRLVEPPTARKPMVAHPIPWVLRPISLRDQYIRSLEVASQPVLPLRPVPTIPALLRRPSLPARNLLCTGARDYIVEIPNLDTRNPLRLGFDIEEEEVHDGLRP